MDFCCRDCFKTYLKSEIRAVKRCMKEQMEDVMQSSCTMKCYQMKESILEYKFYESVYVLLQNNIKSAAIEDNLRKIKELNQEILDCMLLDNESAGLTFQCRNGKSVDFETCPSEAVRIHGESMVARISELEGLHDHAVSLYNEKVKWQS